MNCGTLKQIQPVNYFVLKSSIAFLTMNSLYPSEISSSLGSQLPALVCTVPIYTCTSYVYEPVCQLDSVPYMQDKLCPHAIYM